MPVLRIKKDGIWEELGGTSPMNGGNADTLDGKHADEFALYDDVNNAFDNAYNDLDNLGSELNSLKERVDNDFNTLDTNLDNEFNNIYDGLNYACSGVNYLYARVGDESVSDQIDKALENFSSGKTLTQHLTEEDMVLSSRQYGDTLPPAGTKGRIFFLKEVD